MHLDQSALGILRKAEDKNGRKYMDWRIPYMDQPGLIMVYKSDSRYEKYMIYFFTSPASDCPGKYLHTTYGSIQVEDGSLTIRTRTASMNLNWMRHVFQRRIWFCCYIR